MLTFLFVVPGLIYYAVCKNAQKNVERKYTLITDRVFSSPDPMDKKQVINVLLRQYPNLELGKVLGKGSSSEARVFSFKDEEGKTQKRVLKLAQFEKASNDHEAPSFALTQKRIGGEWFALHSFDGPVVKTEAALAFDNNQKKFVLLSADDVQKMLNNPEARKGKNYIFIGSVSEYVENSRELKEEIRGNRGGIKEQRCILLMYRALKAVKAVHDASFLVNKDEKQNLVSSPKSFLGKLRPDFQGRLPYQN